MSPLGSTASAPPLVSELHETVVQWLLEGPAQLRDGPHAGAVVGSVDAGERATYAYPEITGYFLQWLGWRSRSYGSSPALMRRAAAAQAWLRTWLAEAHPRTRIHLHADVADWRNDAVFCFDVAMVLRGLGTAAHQGLLDPDPVVVAGLVRELARLIGDDGLFVACRTHAKHGSALPTRWSTRRGGFLAKAAAGVIAAARTLGDVPEPVTRAAEETYAASLRWDADAPHEDVHPLLYTFEGIMSLPTHPLFQDVLPVIAARFDALLTFVGDGGQLPETIGTGVVACAPNRVDIMAQVARIGALLAMHRPHHPPDGEALAKLKRSLEQEIAASGAVPFALAQPTRVSNVWAAMFVDQALAYSHERSSDASPTDDPLIV